MNDPEYLNVSAVKLFRSPSEKTVTIEINFGGGELVPDIILSRLVIVIAEEGVILGGRLELSKLEPSLPVSPGSLEAPPDEGWQG